MARVYIAGPYTNGETILNVRHAIEAATDVLDAGHAPFVPHLSHFWHMMRPRAYDVWIKLDLAFVETCDAVLRLHGESPGADGEVARARELGIPVYYSVSSLLDEIGRT